VGINTPRDKGVMPTDEGQDVFAGADFGLDSDEEKTKGEEREKRTFQSEKDFLHQKQNWNAKVETREVISTCPLSFL
jgi:hypothetical protein